jgi:uroporphyrinogen-III synthase
MKTIAVTRPVGEGRDTASLIRKLGWTPLIFHTVELKPRPIRLVSHELDGIVSTGVPDWLVFMSPRGAGLFFDALRSMKAPAKAIIDRSRVLAVGPKTEASLKKLGAKNVEIPGDYSSEGIAAFFSNTRARGKRVVLTRSSQASNALEKKLKALGALTTTIRLYDSSIPTDHRSVLRFLSELKSGRVKATLFTSSLSATNLFKMNGGNSSAPDLRRLLGKCLVGAIGPTTSARLRTLGVSPALMPIRFLIKDALIALIEAAEGEASRISQ